VNPFSPQLSPVSFRNGLKSPDFNAHILNDNSPIGLNNFRYVHQALVDEIFVVSDNGERQSRPSPFVQMVSLARRHIEPASDSVKDASDNLPFLFQRVAVRDGQVNGAKSDKNRHEPSPVTTTVFQTLMMPQVFRQCIERCLQP
jgi:hypothetical protein